MSHDPQHYESTRPIHAFTTCCSIHEHEYPNMHHPLPLPLPVGGSVLPIDEVEHDRLAHLHLVAAYQRLRLSRDGLVWEGQTTHAEGFVGGISGKVVIQVVLLLRCGSAESTRSDSHPP